ncbi:ABC transporter substrate-binding protein [Paenibacillus sp. IB182496]|uniref:ABC transporter substrate-binding protein n=1 Tax=Paenibacillus sabuli TaxID=2772509 RepID=A0A927GUF2_9BACL|nr:ABC transporter substrate-binding protein [Paenibacillus sabuli]MBD2848296.1 ABC transporter substrate-binding protein [Paenibacillus sabuli]
MIHALYHRLRLTFVLLALLLIAAGCSHVDSDGLSRSTIDTAPVEPATRAGNNDEPVSQLRIFTDSTGREVEVPVDPQRIIALEYTGYLHVLGVKPIATAPRFFKSPFLELMDGVENIGYPADLEKMLALEPELIIAADYLTPEQVESYSKIAPVVLLKWVETDNLNRLEAVAELLDRHKQADAWLASYQQLVQDTRDSLADTIAPGETASIFYAWGTSVNLLAPQVISTLYADIGFEPSEKMKARMEANPEFAAETISREIIGEYAADRMFIIAEGALGEELIEELKHSVLQTLPAFKEDRVYALDPNWYSFEPVLMEWQLRDIVKVLKP